MKAEDTLLIGSRLGLLLHQLDLRKLGPDRLHLLGLVGVEEFVVVLDLEQRDFPPRACGWR